MKKIKQFVLAIIFLTGLNMAAQTPDQIDPNVAGMIPDVQKMQETMAKLKELEPLTNDQLKSWFPQSIGGLELINIEENNSSMPNVTSLMAGYATRGEEEFVPGNGGADLINKNFQAFRVEVMDGAGPTGSAVVASMGMMTGMNFAVEDDKKQQETIERNGIKAQQTYHKKTNTTEVQFLHGGRFSIGIKGRNMDSEETWNHIRALKLSDLSDFGD